MTAVLDAALRLWKALPLGDGLRARLAPAIAATVRAVRRRPPPARQPLAAIAAGPLVLSGFLGDALGLGAAARSTLAGLREMGLSVIPHDLGFIRTVPLYASIALPAAGHGGVWICQCNPPEFERLRLGLDHHDLDGRYRIGVWAWELETLPPVWVEAARSFNELWAPSAFVARAIETSLGPGPGPLVRVIPLALGPPAAVAAPRAQFGLEDATFVVLTLFDLRSTRARKNPDGAIDAFVRAFPEPSARQTLICKVLASQAAPAEFEALRRRVAERSDIRLITETLSDAAVGALIDAADVLLSLHRSEGYGLTLAEAMHRGRAVVATGWSGNMDFMDDRCAMIIPYALQPVRDPQGQYAGLDARWAEPDVAAAAEALLQLAASPDLRARLGAEAQVRIAAHEAGFRLEVARSVWLSKIDGSQVWMSDAGVL